MGEVMKSHGYRPDIVLCSTAARALETRDRALPAFGEEIDLFGREVDWIFEILVQYVLEGVCGWIGSLHTDHCIRGTVSRGEENPRVNRLILKRAVG